MRPLYILESDILPKDVGMPCLYRGISKITCAFYRPFSKNTIFWKHCFSLCTECTSYHQHLLVAAAGIAGVNSLLLCSVLASLLGVMGDLCNLKNACLCPGKLEMVACAQILPRHEAEGFGSYPVRWHLRKQSEFYFKGTHTFSQFISNVCFSSFSLLFWWIWAQELCQQLPPWTVPQSCSVTVSDSWYHLGFSFVHEGGLFECVCLFLDLETLF